MKPNKKKIAKSCLICKQEFSTFPCLVKIGKGKYCSSPCYYESKKRSDVPGGYKKGHPNSNTGRTHFKSRTTKGKLNINWKGDKVGYLSLHTWLYRNYGKPDCCKNLLCEYPRKTNSGKMLTKPTRFEWANITGTYQRDIKNWVMLCSLCHRLLDRSGYPIKL